MNGGQGDGGANGVQYDEIPYGDVGPGPSGKGQLPEVPVEYSQVPQIPQRQGTLRFLSKIHLNNHFRCEIMKCIFMLECMKAIEREWMTI